MNNASKMLETSVEKIRDLVDVSTIVGEPIVISDTLQVIPVSKVTYGFASGGTDFPSKSKSDLFGGGGGAGITINPVAFLIVNNGNVSVKYVNSSESSVEHAIGMIPDVVDKVADVVTKLTNKDDDAAIDEAIDEFVENN